MKILNSAFLWLKTKICKIWNDGIVITNSSIPKYTSWFISVYAITLYPFVFIKDEGNPRTIRHERIHLRQQREMFIIGIFFFYILYVGFWLYHLVRLRNSEKAYFSIPFEREAFDNDEDENYLKNRKWLAWIKYINQNESDQSSSS